ncbi:MAG: hypothetical protein M0Q94_06565 [Candidatus Cloacimonetes bacterium]|nr:hypothetical protein [Candidatus Cloacimonadota bacterium]
MDELRDKLLESVLEVAIQEEVKPLAFEIPANFYQIPDNVINLVSIYMTAIINYKRYFGENAGKEVVEVKTLIINTKKMFSPETKNNDNLWRQHCAASVREIVCFVQPSDYNKAIKCIPDCSDPRVEKQFSSISDIYTYLSDIVHFVSGPRRGYAQKILPERRINEMKEVDFLQNEDVIFEEICIQLIYKLHEIFIKYCVSEQI